MIDGLVTLTKGVLAIEARQYLGQLYRTPSSSRVDRINAIAHLLFFSFQVLELTLQKKSLMNDPQRKVWFAKTVGILDVARTVININALMNKREKYPLNELRRDLLDSAAILAFRLCVYMRCYTEKNQTTEPTGFKI